MRLTGRTVAVALGVAMTVVGLTAAADATTPSSVPAGHTIPAGQHLISRDGLVDLYVQSNGDVVLFGGGLPLWRTGTAGHPAASIQLQTDGKLVVRSATGAAIFARGTHGSGATGLRVNDSGAVEPTDAAGRVRWELHSRLSVLAVPTTMNPGSSLTASTGERLIMQGDGNLVAYRGNAAYWASGTAGHPGARGQLQGDGNLVVRGTDGRALWASYTQGTGPKRLVIEPGGVPQLRNSGGQAVWTAGATTRAPVRYTFPVVPAGGVSYAEVHHDYPATDIFTACGSNVVGVTGGVIQEVRTVDVWEPATNDPATRGGITVSLIGDDGVRYYSAHFHDLVPRTRAGERVSAGQLLGHAGESGDARGLGCHVHLGMSPACGPGDWSIRSGVFYPWPYLDSWRSGGQRSPVAQMQAWQAAHAAECAAHRLNDPIPDP